MAEQNYTVFVVGSGGTGTYFLKEISRYLSNKDRSSLRAMYIIDGDVIEKKNLSRQAFIDDDIVDGIQVWSIFKRKRGLRGDGNPLIYALKGEGGWHFRDEYDERMIYRQIDLICDKFINLYPVGVTIVIPSGNPLNDRIAEIILSKSKNGKLINGAICKMTVEEVDEIVLKMDSDFRRYYGENFAGAYRQLCRYFDAMDKERNGTFSRHLVKDSEMRNVLNNTLKLSKEITADIANDINGQHVLLIDDSISRGQTIKEACSILNESYAPKTITVLTLLSKLY